MIFRMAMVHMLWLPWMNSDTNNTSAKLAKKESHRRGEVTEHDGVTRNGGRRHSVQKICTGYKKLINKIFKDTCAPR